MKSNKFRTFCFYTGVDWSVLLTANPNAHLVLWVLENLTSSYGNSRFAITSVT